MDSSDAVNTTSVKTLDQMQRELFNLSELNNILRRTLETDGFMLKGHGIFALSDRIEGFLGQHFILELEYVEDGQSDVPRKRRYFMKLLNGSFQIIFEITLSLNAYEKEKFFYEHLLGEYERHGVDASFAPKGYLCKPYVVVLEDLSSRSLENTPKSSFWDVSHCEQALTTLAKLHSSSIIYEHKMTEQCRRPYSLAKEHPSIFKEILYNKKSDSVIKAWYKCSVDGVLKLIDMIPEIDNTRKELFKEKLKQLYEDSPNALDNMDGYKQTILHGDVWSNNFMFKYENGTPVQCVLIDYQLLKYGPPSFDVLQMLYSNTIKKFRDTHMEELLHFYYKRLRAFLPNFCMDEVLPKNDFLQVCTKFKALIKLYCICDRCVTLVPDNYIRGKIDSNEDLRLFLLENRCQAITECYQVEELFKELITEDLIEFCEILLKE